MQYLKQVGDFVKEDEAIVSLETDKITQEVPAPTAGTLTKIMFGEGDTVQVGDVVARLSPGEPPASSNASESDKKDAPKTEASPPPKKEEKAAIAEKSAPSSQPANSAPQQPAAAAPPSTTTAGSPGDETRVPMTRMRRRISERLKDAQNTYAMLTTFNEIDMSSLIAMRNEYKDAFAEKHGIKLGFMSAFVKASAIALEQMPVVNAVIEGTDLVYRNYVDISVAVSAPKGLVVPVIRNAETLNFADIEKTIADFGKRAKNGTLTIEEMQGGTFSISNGGVFGSLFGTPIINPPQSAILGMHATKERPVVVNGKVEVRPMMYVALTYDHRLIDGREAVTFLKKIKELIEDPRRIVLDL